MDQSAGCRGGLSQGAETPRTRLGVPILGQSLSQSLFFNLGYWNSMGPPSIYKGPDLLESTSVDELCSDSLGTQIALLPIQDPVRAATAVMATCRSLCLRSLLKMVSRKGRGKHGLKTLTELNPRNIEQIRRRQIR